MSVLAVTDDPALRDLVCQSQPDHLCAFASDSAGATELLHKVETDVVIIDADLAGTRAVDVAWLVYMGHPEAQIVVVSNRPLDASAGWWTLDVFAFVSKRAGAEELAKYAARAAEHARAEREKRRAESVSRQE